MLENREGQRIPEVTFRVREDGAFRDLRSEELFAGKTVILFALPGAFTPTCSSTHLPRYEQLAGVFAKHGVDDIICLSVNDPFVMETWGKSQNASAVRMLPDGNGEFTAALDMLVDKSELGFGKRSWRYSMLVRDGIIEKMFIEPQVEGDPFEVSDADTMLRYLAPDAQPPAPVTVFSRPGCPHCARAKRVLEEHGYHYEEIQLGQDITTRSLEAVSGAVTTPQVFIGGQLIGTADALEVWLAAQKQAA